MFHVEPLSYQYLIIYRFIVLSFYRFIVLSIYRFIDLSFYRFIVRFIMHLDCLFVDCNVLIMVGFWPCVPATIQHCRCDIMSQQLAMAGAGHVALKQVWRKTCNVACFLLPWHLLAMSHRNLVGENFPTLTKTCHGTCWP